MVTVDSTLGALSPTGKHPLIRLLAAAAIGSAIALGPQVTHAGDIDYSCWNMTFNDEFGSLKLQDASGGTWKTVYTWGDGGINQELQYYADPRQHGVNPFIAQNGHLAIRAQRTPTHLLGKVKNHPYVSGLLTSENSFDQTYGLFELRAQLPKGKGLWPAFWLVPTDKAKWRSKGYDRMPEIDIMEQLGHEPHKYYTTLHTKCPPSGCQSTFDVSSKAISSSKDLSADYHVYGLEWNSKTITWYLDGNEVFSQPTPSDAHDPRYLLINLAVGGKWPGSPDDSTKLPADYLLDYVRVYERKSNCSDNTTTAPMPPVLLDISLAD